MKVLFLCGQNGLEQPSYDLFVEAIDGRYPIEIFDPGKPPAQQFKDVDYVLDPGGSYWYTRIDRRCNRVRCETVAVHHDRPGRGRCGSLPGDGFATGTFPRNLEQCSHSPSTRSC